MDEFRITVTMGRGYTEADAEKLLDRASEYCPEYGPVTSLDVATGDLSLTISFEAEHARDAIEYGDQLAQHLFIAAELERRRIVGVELELTEPELATTA